MSSVRLGLQEVVLDEVVLSKHNPRVIDPQDPAVKELAESIASSGLLQPVVMRPLGEKFELLAGARRYMAHRLLDRPTILAIVRDLSDEQAIAVTVLENLQRQDLKPLEEARGVKELLDAGRTIEEISADVGKSTAWVSRRVKLTELSPAWIGVLDGTATDADDAQAAKYAELRKTPTGALDLLAHTPVHVQDELLAQFLRHSQPDMTLSGMRQAIEYCMLNLRNAPWSMDAEGLGAGPCSACMSRSDAMADLFPDDNDDGARCLDKACYETKHRLWIDQQVKAAQRKAKGPVRLITTTWNRGFGDRENVLRSWQYEEVAKGVEGAVAAIDIDGQDAGKLRYIKVHEETDDLPREAKRQKQQATTEQYRLAHMVESLEDWLEAAEKCPPALDEPKGMLAAVVMYGIADPADAAIQHTRDGFNRLIDYNDELANLAWAELKKSMCCALPWLGDDLSTLDVERETPDLMLMISIVGLDAQDFIDAAAKAYPCVIANDPAPAKGKKAKGKRAA